MIVALLLAIQAEGEVFPIRVGTEWTYQTSTGQTVVSRIVETSKAGGRDGVVVETKVGPQSTREHVAVTTKGLEAYRAESARGAFDYPSPLLRVKLPFREGDAWTVKLQEGFQLNVYEYRTVGKETVTVPAGTFEAWKVVTTLGPAKVTAWYAPGTGMVRQLHETGGPAMSVDLVSTSVGKPAAAAAPAGAFQRYESKDGKVLLYHPGGWKVAEGAMHGPGTYTVTVEAADESAGVLFLSFGAVEGARDSVALAAQLLSNLKKAFPDLAVAELTSTKDRGRSSASVSMSMNGRKVRGRFHFFRTAREGTVYGLFAREEQWEAARPLLAQVTANLAYAPEGVKAVLAKGRDAVAAPKPEGRTDNPAWLIKDAFARSAKGEAADVPMQDAVAQDASFSMQVPRGWHFTGAGLGSSAVDDPRTNARGITSQMYTVFVPGGFTIQQPGMLLSPYLPPVQALDYLVRTARLGTDLRVLSASTILEIDPDTASKVWKPALAAGAQVDNRLLLVEFRNAATGAPTRGLFSMTCTAWPLGTSWTAGVEGSWAPVEEFDRLLPLFARIASSRRQNEQWVRGKFSAQAAESARLNSNLMKSIGELNQSYERYNQGWWETQKSRDYTSWAWSQTTLGQGSWVSEREGAEVVRSGSWGLENLQTGQQTPLWNQTTFTGRSPWTGEQLDEVDTRAEFETYLRK